MIYQNTRRGKVLSINGKKVVTKTQAMTPNSSRPIRIGAGRNESSPAYFFKGSIGEVIMFNTVINEAQQIIVDNYLAAKYGYRLAAFDLYDGDEPSNGNFDHDVAGIGRVRANSTHSSAKGTGIVGFSNPSDLDNNEFLFWGHNNGKQLATDTSDVPVGVRARFECVWQVSERNKANTLSIDVGTVDMSWDLSAMASTSARDLRFLIATDNDGSSSDENPIAGAVDLGNSVYAFRSIPGDHNGIHDNVRFTLGTVDTRRSPLPVQLLSFDVNLLSKADRKVSVTWKTASEINHSHFVVERSSDAQNWKKVKQVSGKGNTTQVSQYEFTDYPATSGLWFYRLISVDVNGAATVSALETVKLEEEQAPQTIMAFPNPFTDRLTLTRAVDGEQKPRIYNVHGMDYTSAVKVVSDQNGKIVLDTRGLPSGAYIGIIGKSKVRLVK